jgi:hexosaminidase
MMLHRMLLTWCILTGLTALGQTPETYALIPKPVSLTYTGGTFTITPSTRILFTGPCEMEAQMLKLALKECGVNVTDMHEWAPDEPQDNIIHVSCGTSSTPTPEEMAFLPGNLGKLPVSQNTGKYTISMSASAIRVNGSDAAGVFYATQTLRQMAFQHKTANSTSIALPTADIRDEPAFVHRGMLLDCCRHFMSKDFVKRYIDLLALHKMNVLHWHLTEDQAWRIEIKSYPKLTEVGAWRTEKNGLSYGGYYSQEDIRDIVAYAQKRHVMIIPEIELPGHAVAALASYPQFSCTGEPIAVQNDWGVFKDIYCAGNEETFTFLQRVMDEVCALFPSPYIHIGGDEVPKYRWENCAKCQKRIADEKLSNETELQTWFINRIAAYLKTKNKQIIGWDEIIEGGIPEGAVVQVWRDVEHGREAASHGHSVVMSPTSHCYFDYGLQSIDLQKVYAFDPVPASFSPTERAMVRGGECNMWTEHAPQELVDSKVFPRILAMAEVLWSYPETRDYTAFRARVATHQKQLQTLGVQSGFAEIPVTFTQAPGWYGMTKVTIAAVDPGTTLTYQHMPLEGGADDPRGFIPVTHPIDVKGACSIRVKAKQSTSDHETEITRYYVSHEGMGKTLTLNYDINPYYPGGGKDALIDGRIGSPDFRDGVWQATQGKDMQAVLDLGALRDISFVRTRWYHYTNAWIFRPEEVRYEYSTDSVTWKMMDTIKAPGALNKLIEQLPYSYVLDAEPGTYAGRYIRMTAINSGPCPPWHEAAGAESWMFVDELEVR